VSIVLRLAWQAQGSCSLGRVVFVCDRGVDNWTRQLRPLGRRLGRYSGKRLGGLGCGIVRLATNRGA
jgi:hypothetical protein